MEQPEASQREGSNEGALQQAQAPLAAPSAPENNGLAVVVERLSSIEERLAAIQGAPRPQSATPELFAEWVRMRLWQEIPFAEFLKLRRAGRI